MDTAPKPLIFRDRLVSLATEEPSLGSKVLLAGALDPKYLDLLICEVGTASCSQGLNTSRDRRAP